MSGSTREYGLAPEHYRAAVRSVVVSTVVLWAFPSAFFLVALPSIAEAHRRTGPSAEIVIPVLLAIVCTHLGLSIWGHRKNWEAFRIYLGPDTITSRSGSHAPVLTISREHVKEIAELSRDRSLVVKTADPTRFVVVPNKLTGFEEVRAELSAWCPIEQGNIEPLVDVPWPILVLLVASVVSVVALFGTKERTRTIVLSLIAVGGWTIGCLLVASRFRSGKGEWARKTKLGCLVGAAFWTFMIVAFAAMKLASVLFGPWPN